MLLMLDNYDSFTYNLVQYLQTLGAEVKVIRNDELSVAEVEALDPSHIVVSPGPCTPNEAGISVAVIERLGPRVPVLGVCLGHQGIGQVYGGDVIRAGTIMHGKTSPIRHLGKGVFAGLPDRYQATRYHSLVVAPESLPDCLEITAKTWTDEIMGVRHRAYVGTPAPLEGVQFHPESIETRAGKQMLANFLAPGLVPGLSSGLASGQMSGHVPGQVQESASGQTSAPISGQAPELTLP